MKKSYISSVRVLTILLGIGLCAPSVQAQHTAATHQKIDSVFLSERMEGDTRIRSYRVEEIGDANYAVLYRINLAKLSTELKENSRELQELKEFMQSLASDSTRRTDHIRITGYASPDGPQAFNERLAKARLNDFLGYGEKHYQLSDRFRLKSSSVAEDWESCRHMVAQSTMPDREKVLTILDDGALSHDEKEARLKQIPAAWDYLKRNILPHLRRVEVEVQYARGRVVEVRTRIPRPTPQPQPVVAQDSCNDPCGECLVVDETITGFIVEYPEE